MGTEKKAFFKKCEWSNLHNTHSSVATNTYFTDEGNCWALRYTHLDHDLGRRRYWYIDVGIRELNETEEAIFYCKISYARDEYDVSGMELPTPPSTTPRFIRTILNPGNGFKVYSRKSSFGLFGVPVPFKLTYGKALVNLIQSEYRRYALLVFNGDSEALSREAHKIARDLAGKAQVITLPQDSEFAQELRHVLSRELHIKHGTFRVFFPMRKGPVRGTRHRWFHIEDADYYEQRAGLVNALLKNYNLTEESAVKNISEVGRMISRANLLTNLASGDNREAQLQEFIDEYTKLEEEKSVVEQERDFYLEEHADMEGQLAELNGKLQALSHHSARQHKDLQVCYQSNFGKLPSTLEETVRVKAELLKDRIIFTEEAFKSAADYNKCQSLDHAWKILFHIGTTLYDIKYSGEPVGDIEKRFKELSGYEYAKTEGQNTKNDSRLRQSRKFKHDGRDYELWSHIKHGIEEPKLIRVYFDYDDQNKKIIVGHVGAHLDNASTRKKR